MISLRLPVVGLLVLLLTPLLAVAVTDSWDGGGADNNFTTNLNWFDNTAPDSNFITTDLIFAGTTRTSVNFNTSFAANSVTFDATAGAFTLSAGGGQTLLINAAGITNKDVDLQTFFNLGINVAIASTTFNAQNGPLTFTGPVAIGTATLNIPGNANTTLQGALTGTGAVSKSGNGTLLLPGNTTLSVDLTSTGGTVAIPSIGTTTFDANSSIAINGGAFNADGNLTINGGLLTKSALAGFNLAAGKVFTLNDTGADFFGGYSQTAPATININGFDSQFSVVGQGLYLGSGAQFNVSGGAFLQATSTGIVLDSAGDSTALVVDGAQSVAGALNANFRIGGSGGSASATFRNDGYGSAGNLFVGTNALPGTVGTLRIESGADFGAEYVYVGQGAGNSGTVTVTDLGTQLTALQGLELGMPSGSTAVLNVQNRGDVDAPGRTQVNATGTIAISGGNFNAQGNITLDGGRLTRDATGVFFLASDKTLTIKNGGDALITGDYSLTTSGTIEVSGLGSTFTQNGGGAFVLGSADVEMATLTLTNGGAFSSGIGTATLHPSGTININDGSVTFNGPVVNNGGRINLNVGTLSYLGHLTVGVGGLLGNDLTLNSNRRLTLDGITTIDPAHTLTLDGGTFYTGAMVVNGTFDFQRGTLGITGAFGLTIGGGGTFGTNLTLRNGQTLNVIQATTINAGSLLVVESGAGFNSGFIINSGELVLNGLAATATAPTVSNGGLIRGEGRILGNVTNAASGEIRAEEGKRIKLQGTNGTNVGAVNLQGGTAEFSDALTNGALGQIVGRGTLSIGGAGLNNQGHVAFSSGITDVFGDVVNNTGDAMRGITVSGNADVTFWDDVNNVAGSLFRVSLSSSATFFGAFSGAGISGFGDVYFEADVTPGASPATASFGGNVSFGPNASLAIELGGTLPGLQYDQLQVATVLSLDGTLEVSLINGFNPSAGQSFDILDWEKLNGAFSSITLPALSSLEWDTSQLYITGVLSVVAPGLPGDYNQNGIVDAADYVVWRKTSGIQDGYNIWRANFGRTAASGATTGWAPPEGWSSSAAIPEPGAQLLWMLALPFLRRRLRTRRMPKHQ